MSKYVPLSFKTAQDHEESQAFIDEEKHERPDPDGRSPRLLLRQSILPWTVSCILLILYAYELFTPTSSLGPFETDLKDAQRAVAYEEKHFTGHFAWDEAEQTIYRVLPPDEPLFFGEPSDEIDRAWEDLSRGKFLAMNEEEVDRFKAPDLLLYPDGNYYFTFQMFHSLHCLNMVRMRLDKDYYESHVPSQQHKNLSEVIHQPGWERTHIDHCLDQIRQSIQCAGDLSPVPIYGWGGIPVGFGVGQAHTCRKWQPIQEWMVERHELGMELHEGW
ncbi:hypothetical protein F4778DRAFT_481781 [Xylariomycetidae sp. FL2044]|nr:hypothetical protein F4778DRAFT_481781 [Xylariomycetidae sp. FL2044]